LKRLDLYENIPETSSLIRINLYDELCKPIFQIHWHGHLEIHYIIEGTAVERCENDVIRVNAGECVVINSNELHEGLDGNCRYLCILVPQHFAKNSNIILNRVVKDEEIGSMAKCIIEEYKDAGNLYKEARTQFRGASVMDPEYRRRLYFMSL